MKGHTEFFKDVCDVLGYSRSRDAVRQHCKHAELLKGGDLPLLTESPYGITIIPESDLYRRIMRSNMFGAEMFQAWVTEEVLPEIGKDGGYISTRTSEGALSHVRDDRTED